MSKENQESFSKTSINWYPGHMAKTKREIKEDLKLIDVVIEILDARIPISSRNPDMNEIIENKKKIVILNKCDLADKKQNELWVKHFKENGIPAVLINSNTGEGIKNVIPEIEKIMEDEMQKSALKGRIGRIIRVLVLGIPNVGKSSFINRISQKTSAKVGNKPGVTVRKQWIRIKNNIELLDTPGVLWPKFQSQEVALNLSYTGTIKDEVLDKEDIAFNLIKKLKKEYLDLLYNAYNLEKEQTNAILEKLEDENEQILELMNIMGRKRGTLVSGGNVDLAKISDIILRDFRTAKIGKITLEKI